MIGKLNSQQRGQANAMYRGFGYGSGFADLLDDILGQVQAGAIGITADAGDVDSLALGGGAFGVDADGTSGLTLALRPGRVRVPAGVVAVAAGSVALAASHANYVEVDGAGVVTSNTSGFTVGRCPLYVVTTASSAIATTVSAKALLSLVPPGSVNGALLTAAAATRVLARDLGGVTATAHVLVAAPVAGRLSAAVLLADSAAAASDTDYWTFGLVNAGQANAGTAALLAATNTTRATGGSAIAARVVHPLTLAAVTVGTELNVAPNDCLVFTATATGSPPALSSLSLQLSFTFAN